MADEHKKDISVDVTITPFSECKKKEAPAWFAARPKLASGLNDVKVSRSMKLDGRKWKKKDLEDGVYAIAKYNLAVFSSALTAMEKEIDKTFDASKGKKKRDAKFYKGNIKAETKPESAVLGASEKKVAALWKKLSKAIEDKVSLALDEVESDKGDNKKAIAAGKQALKVFGMINTDGFFADPISEVTDTLKKLGNTLAKPTSDSDEAHKAALRNLRDVESEYDLVAKSTGKVAKMFLALGEKIAKDKNADGELQKFGEKIAKGTLKNDLQTLKKNIKDLGKDLDVVVNFVAKGDNESKAVLAKMSKFNADHAKKKGTATAITAQMRTLASDFKKIERKLK